MRPLLLALILLALLPAAAPAALPAAHPPPARVAGVRVSWPRATVWATGATVRVGVASPRRRATVALQAVNADGRAFRTVARRTLRSGAFRATLPGPGSYALRLSLAGRRYWSWLTVPAPLPPPPAPAPPADPCATVGPNWPEPEVLTKVVRPGDTVQWVYHGIPPGCLHDAPEGAHFEQLVWPYWVPLPEPTPIVSETWVGTDWIKAAVLPADAPPGKYLLRDGYTGEVGGVIGGGSVVDDFEAVAP